ncbi:MAG: threonine synthase [Hyphomicrobiaceae bacterium]|jgi:threonine synthase
MSSVGWPGLIEHYRDRLPVGDARPVTLHEGNTPLIAIPRLAQSIGLDAQLWVKYEGLNPTGSFKDRGMTMAMTMAVADGATAVICASTGNTSAAAAAYASRAGLSSFVIIPDGNIALGKLSQAVMHGAMVIAIDGNFDDAFRMVEGIAAARAVTVVNSINPYRLQGQKTAAFEVCDVLGDAPDFHILPVGNAGNISAYWMGYKEYHADGVCGTRPRMMGYQAAGAAPLVLGHPVANPETIATAIRIGNPVSRDLALAARDESGGTIDMVTDTEILAAYKLLASSEGIFAEPASAASVAGLIKLVAAGEIPKGARVVCTLTGHGLKDPSNAIENCAKPIRVKPELEIVLDVMGI